jgi:hypothetical protein
VYVDARLLRMVSSTPVCSFSSYLLVIFIFVHPSDERETELRTFSERVSSK